MGIYIKFTLLIFLSFLISERAEARVRRQKKETKEFYENGTLRKYTMLKTSQTIGFEADNNYKKTKLLQKEYHENGKLKSTYQRKTKIGNFGKDCYEVKTIERTFDENGTLRKKEVHRCDSGKTVIEFFDAQGKLEFTRVIYEIK